jgi:hypothetical protein
MSVASKFIISLDQVLSIHKDFRELHQLELYL